MSGFSRLVLLALLALLQVAEQCDDIVTDTRTSGDCNNQQCHQEGSSGSAGGRVLEENLFRWINENGGFVNDKKLEISTGRDPKWNVRGIFASKALGNNELVLSLPPSLRICSLPEDNEMSDPTCQLIKSLAKEIGKGSSSFFKPYLDILASEDVSVPFTWRKQEYEWISDISPHIDWRKNDDFMKQSCGLNPSDSILSRAALLVTSRATDVILDEEEVQCMCPVYDLLNHDNRGINTMGAVSGGGEQVLSVGMASAVDKGIQLFNSFGENNVARIFRDYGFLPSYPRAWEIFYADNNGRSGVYLFEEVNEVEVNLNPTSRGVNNHISDQKIIKILRMTLARTEERTSYLNETDVIPFSENAEENISLHTNTSSIDLLKAQWFRFQYTMALKRALRTAEASDPQSGDAMRKRKKTRRKKRKVAVEL